MNAKIATYYKNAKSAFTFVFDDGCYYDSTMEAYKVLKEVYEKTGVKIKITSAQTVNFISPTLKNMWDELFKEGYFDLAGHSVSHCLGYNKNTPYSELEKDATETKKALEEMYGIPVLTFVTPGGGDDYEGLEVLRKHYIANRNGHDRINDTYNMDLYDIGTFTARFAYDTEAPYIENIEGTIEKGGWSVQINHWLSQKTEDTHHAQRLSTFMPECMYIAKKAIENELWVCSLNDMAKYIYIRDNSTPVIENGKLRLESKLDKAVFDIPVSVILEDRVVDIALGQEIQL